jgi:G3E family GTPase
MGSGKTMVIRRVPRDPGFARSTVIVDKCGERLIWMKCLVSIEQMSRQPTVVHGVRHVFSPPEFQERWPSDDTNTRIVFTSRDGAARCICVLFAVLCVLCVFLASRAAHPMFRSRLLHAIEEVVRANV